VGIGIGLPSTQFHTTGGVRFEGITADNTLDKVLVQDADGNLFFRSAATIGSQNAWLLGGNAGTNSAINFLGTTDNTRFVFRTNGFKKATFLANGNFGVATNSPTHFAHIYNSNINTKDNNLYLSGNSTSIRLGEGLNFTQNAPASRIGVATRVGAFVTTSAIRDFVIGNPTLPTGNPATGGNLIFATNLTADQTNNLERARIDPNGFFGINTITPSARFHTNGTVRFENVAGWNRQHFSD
jgi:hypothetical protein